MNRNEARKLFDDGVALTLFCKGGRARSWQYCTIRLQGDTVLIRAPGANRWTPLRKATEEEVSALQPHGQAAYRLATGVLLPFLAGRTLLTTGMVLAESGECRKCGKPLTNPDSLAEGYGPECGKRARDRAAKRAAKRMAADNFTAAMLARMRGA